MASSSLRADMVSRQAVMAMVRGSRQAVDTLRIIMDMLLAEAVMDSSSTGSLRRRIL